LLTTAFQHPRYAGMVNYWWPHWRMVARKENYLCSYGHDLELIWLVLDAARLLQLPPRGFTGWARRVSDNSLRYGFDSTHGGVYFTGPFGRRARDRRKEWWVQAESLIAFLTLYRLTGEPAYYGAFARTLEFVRAHQAAPGGGWWRTLDRAGAPLVRGRAWEWQGAYHSGRSMAVCRHILEGLAADGVPQVGIGSAAGEH
jgi:mannobiose 2-epimerase